MLVSTKKDVKALRRALGFLLCLVMVFTAVFGGMGSGLIGAQEAYAEDEGGTGGETPDYDAQIANAKNQQACDDCIKVLKKTPPVLEGYGEYAPANSDSSVFRGGHSNSGLQGSAASWDNEPNDFATVLPYGNTYIDASRLTWSDPDKYPFIIDIQDERFKWIAGENKANVKAKNSAGEEISPNTDPMGDKRGLDADQGLVIAYVGPLTGYLDDGKTANYYAKDSIPNGKQNTIEAPKGSYLYRLIYPGAATLKDGTKGNLVITVDKVVIETTLTSGKALIRLQGANNMSLSASTKDASGNNINQIEYVVKTGTEVATAMKDNTAWPASYNQDKITRAATGVLVDLEITVTDAAGNPVNGSISYAASDLDFENYQDLWGRSITADSRYMFNEGLAIQEGALSYAVTPYYNHANGETVDVTTVNVDAETTRTTTPGWVPVAPGEADLSSPLMITGQGSDGMPNGVRFSGTPIRVIRDKDGSFDNALFGSSNNLIVSSGQTISAASKLTNRDLNSNTVNAAVKRQLNDKDVDGDNNPDAWNSAAMTNENVLKYLGLGSVATQRNDADASNPAGKSFDTGFAVLLDASGSRMQWSASNHNGGSVGTNLFDTTIYTYVEQTHGTGGGIYFETYDLANGCVPSRAEGTATMGKGRNATVSIVPEDGYRAKTIQIGGAGLSSPATFDLETLTFDDNNLYSGSYTDGDGVSNNITIKKNDDGTYDVTFINMQNPRHVHVDFTADYYFYKVWKGEKEPTDLTLTATPFAFVARSVTLDGTKYTINGNEYTDKNGNKYTLENNALTIGEGADTKVYYLQGNQLVTYDRTDPDNPVIDKTFKIRLDYVQKGEPQTFVVAKADADNESELNVIKDKDDDGYEIWKVTYPADGYTTKAGQSWPVLPIETEATNHAANHIERTYWFVTEEALGWALVAYDNTHAEAPGKIDAAQDRGEVYQEGSSGNLSAWAAASIKDYDQAEAVIESASDNEHAYMSVFNSNDNEKYSWGGEIVNVPAIVVNVEKTWDDYSNAFDIRDDVWFHIDAVVNGETVKDILPPQKLAKSEAGDEFKFTWGTKEAYGDAYLSEHEGFENVKVVGKQSDIPNEDKEGNTIYYIADENNPHKFLPKTVDGYTDVEGISVPNYADIPDETIYYVNELSDLNSEAIKITYVIRETDKEGNDFDAEDSSKLLKGYTAEIEDVTLDEEQADLDGMKVDSYTGKVTNTLETVEFEIKKRWQDDEDIEHTEEELAALVSLFNDNGKVTGDIYADMPVVEEDSDNPGKGFIAKWSQLPKYIKVTTGGGDEVVEATYYALESEVSGYNTTYKNTGDNAEETDKAYDGGMIVNTQQTEVKATKVWEDNNNEWNIRKDVTFSLTTGGEKIDGSEKTVSKDAEGAGLTVTWTGLDKYKNGSQLITYKVVEADVNPYSQKIEGDQEEGFTVTNTFPPNDETRTIEREIEYTYITEDGLTASKTVKQTITLKRSVQSYDEDNAVWGPWEIVEDECDNEDVESPEIDGWTPDQTTVPKWELTAEELEDPQDGKTVHVVYQPAVPTAEPMVTKDGQYDSATGDLKTQNSGVPSFKLGTKTLPDGSENSFTYKLDVPLDEDGNPVEGATVSEDGKTVTVPGEGTYTLEEDGSITFVPEEGFTGKASGVRITGTDKLDQSVTTTYTPIVVPNKEVQTIERVIEYKYINEEGEEVTEEVVQTVTVERIGDYDPEKDDDPTNYNDTDSKTTIDYSGDSNKWTVADLDKVESPEVEGWTPDQKEIEELTGITPENAEANGFVKEEDEEGNVKWVKKELVIYTPEPPTAEPDETWGAKGEPQTGEPKFQVGTETLPDGSPNTIENIKLVDPETGKATDKVVIPGQGTYTIDEDGKVTFTPEDDFVGDPTPVEVVGTDKLGQEVTTTYTPHVKDPTSTVKRTITYEYDDGTPVLDEDGNPLVKEEIITFTGIVDPKTGEITYPEGEDEKSFDKVTSPDVEDWTPDRDAVDKETVKPGDKDIEEKVVYTKNPEKLPPKGSDDETWGQPGKKQTGKPEFTRGSGKITGYALQDPDEDNPNKKTVPGEGVYEIDPETGEVTFTPEDGFTGKGKGVTVVATDENGFTATGNYVPNVKDATSTVKRTITYEYDDGTPVLDEDGNPLVKEEIITFKGVVDPKTGEVTYPEGEDEKSFDKVTSPDVDGWTPDRDDVDKETVKPGDKDIEEKVIYTKSPEKDPPKGSDDETWGLPGEKQTGKPEFTKGSGKITGYALQDPDEDNPNRKTVPGEGVYEIDPETGEVTFTPEDGFTGKGKGITVVATDENGLTATGNYVPNVVDPQQEKTGKRTIRYYYEDGSSVIGEDGKPMKNVETVEFVRKAKSVDPKTGEVTEWGPWEKKNFSEIKSPELDGYRADRTAVDSVPANPGDDIYEPVVYIKDPIEPTTKTIYKTVTRTIRYRYLTEDGEIAEVDVTQSATFEQIEYTYPDGTVTYGDWIPEGENFSEVVSPEIQGYFTNTPKVPAITVTPDMDDIVETVIYTPEPTIWVTYIDPDGTTIYLEKTTEPKADDPSKQTEPDAPTDPTKDGFTFKGWDRTVDEKGNITYIAKWEPVPEPDTYWVIYIDENGNKIYMEQTTVNKGEAEPPGPPNPTKDGFNFLGWDRIVDKDGNITYIARWEPIPEIEPAPKAIWVTYIDPDGVTIYLEKTAEPKADDPSKQTEPKAPANPTKAGYIFAGWDRSVDEEGNITYVAKWEPVKTPEPKPEPKDKAPATGDASDMIVWLGLACASMVMMGYGRRKRAQK